MTKLRILISLLLVLSLGAGILLGMSLGRRPAPPERMSPLRIAEELGLNAQQREQMKGIWQDMVRNRFPQHGDLRRQYQIERDDAILALLNEEQKAKYAKIAEKYTQQLNDLGKQREADFLKAVEKTKAILTDTQKAKYEEILKRFPGPMGGGERPPMDERRGPRGMGPESGPGPGPEGDPSEHPSTRPGQ